jgi:prephenate dehydrogenase
MGGSVAAALRKRGLASRIVGYDRDGAASARALALGLIDAQANTAGAAVSGADLVMLAAPVGAMPGLMGDIAGALGQATVVTDLGSTKADVLAAAARLLGSAFDRFVPAHPIAGRERFGPEHADADLFEGRVVVTTPSAQTSVDAVERVEALWRACGARVERMEAAQHDRVLASVSHLPHLLAFALVAQIAGQPDAPLKLALAGGGFRDFTRIAASSAVMWRDIALANREALVVELKAYRRLLEELERALDAGDAAWIENLFERAGRARRSVAEDARGA